MLKNSDSTLAIASKCITDTVWNYFVYSNLDFIYVAGKIFVGTLLSKRLNSLQAKVITPKDMLSLMH